MATKSFARRAVFGDVICFESPKTPRLIPAPDETFSRDIELPPAIGFGNPGAKQKADCLV
ncbi:MAG TPA: hypothetical protein VF599_15345 [Pyrinomonadaceae bacterium]